MQSLIESTKSFWFENADRVVLGIVAPVGGAALSINMVEAWLRIASLVIGSAVGIISFISIYRKMSSPHRHRITPKHTA